MNIICAGFGGQGVLTAGLILGKTAVDMGKRVTWIPSYGSEMRGGTANCNLKISDKKIASPFVRDIDILIVMNMPSLDKFEQQVVPGGVIVANKTMIDRPVRGDVSLIEVEATAIADELHNPKGANLAMLGALASSGVLFDAETMEQGIERFFASKGKVNAKNGPCFSTGLQRATQRKAG